MEKKSTTHRFSICFYVKIWGSHVGKVNWIAPKSQKMNDLHISIQNKSIWKGRSYMFLLKNCQNRDFLGWPGPSRTGNTPQLTWTKNKLFFFVYVILPGSTYTIIHLSSIPLHCMPLYKLCSTLIQLHTLHCMTYHDMKLEYKYCHMICWNRSKMFKGNHGGRLRDSNWCFGSNHLQYIIDSHFQGMLHPGPWILVTGWSLYAMFMCKHRLCSWSA